MHEHEVLQLFERCSNVGRWGPDDELGTLNFVTAEKRVVAARLVRDGRVVSLGRDLQTAPSRSNPAPIVHRMLDFEHANAMTCMDTVEIAPHGYAVTHLDATGHVYFEGLIWNGRSVRDTVTRAGLRFASVHALRDGIFTRGILLDVARARGVPWLRPDEAVYPQDLEAAERLARVRVESGDAIVVRVGLAAREAEEGEEDPAERAGLAAECLAWLHEREVAVYAGDCIERLPQPYERVPLPLHMVGMVAMGLVMLDNPAVEELARVCAELGRGEFLLTCAPLRIPGATGSAVNPLAVF